MVEMHYPLMEDRTLFNEFYHKHISMLLTINGFLSAQRLECTHEARSRVQCAANNAEAAYIANCSILQAPARTNHAC